MKLASTSVLDTHHEKTTAVELYLLMNWCSIFFLFSVTRAFTLALVPVIGRRLGNANPPWMLPARSTPKLKLHLSARTPSASDTNTTTVTIIDSILERTDRLWSEHAHVVSMIPSREEILRRIQQQHVEDCKFALEALAPEHKETSIKNIISYEWIHTGSDHYPLATQSLEPILNDTSLNLIRQAASDHWRNPSNLKSRFTYQIPGNYEAHVADLGDSVKTIVNDMLTERIYPMIRHAFFKDNDNVNKVEQQQQQQLCVYDALYIRYNATQAKLSNVTIGAGQPLHRDLGLVSVNVMMNPANDFVAGGTFFENQMRSSSSSKNNPLKPIDQGHCLLHRSSERHAGAATMQGVRDIMVFFVTGAAAAASTTTTTHDPPPPAVIQSSLLKQCRTYCETCFPEEPLQAIFCRLSHLRLAVEVDPTDGEAFQYLGLALMQYESLLLSQTTTSLDDDASKRIDVLETAVECLEQARVLTPCDSRVYNNLALTLSRLDNLAPDQRHSLGPRIEQAYTKATELLQESLQAGCNVQDELDTVSLNHGLCISNLDRFQDACSILERVASRKVVLPDQDCGRVVEDAYRLWRFCESRAK
jgi:tetratricopeptide (TPR) repeat protein